MTGPQRCCTALISLSNLHMLESNWLQRSTYCLQSHQLPTTPVLNVVIVPKYHSQQSHSTGLSWSQRKGEQIHKEWTCCPLCRSTGCSDCFTHTAGWLIIMGFYAIPPCPPPIELSTPPHPLRAWDALTVISLWQHLDVPSLSRPCYWDDSPENVAIVPKRASDEQLFLSEWKTMKKKEREDRQFSSFLKATPV